MTCLSAQEKMYANVHISWWMLNRAVMGIFRSKIEVKSRKCFCRGNFLFVPFNPIFYVWTMRQNFKNIPAKFQSRPTFLAGVFFFKRVTDDDDRRKTFFLASCSEYTSLISRFVTMEYRTSNRGMRNALLTIDACISSESALRELSAHASVVRPANSLFFHCASWASNFCAWPSRRHPTFFILSEGAVVRTNILSPDLSCLRQVDFRLAVEKFDSSLNIGDRLHELPFPSRQTVMHTVIMTCQFTRNDSLTWLVESQRR